MSAWMLPRRTLRSTLLTATKPLNSLVSPRVSRMVSLSLMKIPPTRVSPPFSKGGLGGLDQIAHFHHRLLDPPHRDHLHAGDRLLGAVGVGNQRVGEAE